MPKHPRVVNDTNVWLSALYFSGKPAQIVNLIEDRKIVSVTSSFLLKELEEKMLTNFNTPPFLATATISYIQTISDIVSIKGVNFGLRNPADDKVLETAVVGKCGWLITGDKDLLILKKYKNIKVVTPSQFLYLFQGD